MSKGGKLTKLKSVLKKMQSFKLGPARPPAVGDVNDLQAVYVGQSRRRYLLPSEVINNPIFSELVRDEDEDEHSDSGSITICCEVVLFDHLLWMLGNADLQPESLHELVQFYAC